MRAGDWSLLAEGGAHVVLQPSATSPFRGRVLRLRKRPRQGQAGPERDEEVALEFARLVVERLLSPELCARLEPVAVGSDFLSELAEGIESHRSVKRRAVDEVDTTRLTAVLADDLVGSLPGRSVLSVEIKPKWGFLPATEHLSSASRLIKARHCRFCLHDYLRATRVPAVHRYCPLDLYSSDPARVERAVEALWDRWMDSQGGTNNLRIFLDGRKLHPTEVRERVEMAADYQVGDRSALANRLGVDASALPSAFAAHIASALLASPMLRRLAELQRTLDPLDIEGLDGRYAAEHGQALEDAENVGPEATVAELEAIAERFDPATATLRELELAYILSASFKDCSIFVRMVEGAPPVVKAVDVDMKQLAKLPAYARLDRSIREAGLAAGPDVLPICTSPS